MHWFIRIRDDRGKKVGLVRVYGLAAVLPRFRELPPEVHRAVVIRYKAELWIDPGRAALVVLVTVLAWLALYGFGLAAILYSRQLFPDDAWALLLGMVAALPIGCALCLLALGLQGRTICRLVLDERHCPSCGHDIIGLPVRADRCTICSECGAAWRVPEPKGTMNRL